MRSDSRCESNIDCKVGKAVSEAAKVSVQACRAAKRMLGDAAADMAEAKGYALPDVDLIDAPEELVARIFLPGISKGEIDLRVTKECIYVDARATTFDGRYLRRESSIQGFKRKLILPVEIKPDQVKASLKDGVLEVRMPKMVVINFIAVTIE